MFRFFIDQDNRRIITIGGLTLIVLILFVGFNVAYRTIQSQTEESVPLLTKIFTGTFLIGNTDDFLLCAPVKENYLEMDCFQHGIHGNQFMRKLLTMDNKLLPMHFALKGHEGIKLVKNYRQQDVVAAHAPPSYRSN